MTKVPKVRTSHHRNGEEAARLQALVDKKYDAVPRPEVRSDELLAKLDGAWTEDHKTNLMHYCDLAGQEIRKLRKQLGEAHAETVQTQDELGALLHAAEARIPTFAQAVPNPAAQFVMWCLMEGCWQGDDVDGGAAQHKAEALGLIVQTQYDPAKHGENPYCEPGDGWYVPSPALLAMLESPSVPSAQRRNPDCTYPNCRPPGCACTPLTSTHQGSPE